METTLKHKLAIYALILSLASCGGDDNRNTLNGPIPVAHLSISDSPLYDYGNLLLDSQGNHEFTVTNLGSVSATQITGTFYFSIAFFYVGGTFPGTEGTCGSELSGHSSCTVRVAFNPKAMGHSETTLQLSYYNGLLEMVTSLPVLSGTGI
ncbi:MAG: hypothetical protein EXR74_05100 [Bdellovibrionales bacterium]|nr:hypothetical protein [Bdellovibrionales bacterium]